MALKDMLFGFFDNVGLAEVFHRKAPDATTLRAPLLKGIDNAQRQFEQGQTRVPNRWWKVSNGVVALTVKVKGDTLDINGVATNHMPEDRFVEFLGKFREAVGAGEFDAELGNKGNGDAAVVIPKAGRKNKRGKAGTPGDDNGQDVTAEGEGGRGKTGRGAISPEAAKARGAKAAASRAANRAARAQEGAGE